MPFSLELILFSGLCLFGLRLLLRAHRRRPITVNRAPAVIDGDTLVSNDTRIRLFGIDAPEMSHPHGAAARAALGAALRVHGACPIIIQPRERDRYGRLVARVLASDGTDLAERMVAQGFARAATGYTRAYAGAERRARRSRAGLWSQRGGIGDPAAWRRRHA